MVSNSAFYCQRSAQHFAEMVVEQSCMSQCAWRWKGSLRIVPGFHVIVDGPDFTADLTAQNLNGAVRQHFIDIHVGLCSRTRLKGDEESVDRGSSNDFIRAAMAARHSRP
jgi:hypothetical protein